MNTNTSAQFSAVYAEAAIAFLETQLPQAVIWDEEEARWDFMPADDDLHYVDVAFVLQDGWDGQLSLDNTTDMDADDYNALALRDEIETQMEEEGIARAFIENLYEHRERLADADPGDNESAAEENDDGEGDY